MKERFPKETLFINATAYVVVDEKTPGAMKHGDVKIIATGEIIKNPSLLWLGHLGKLEIASHPDNAIVIKGGD